MQEPQSQYTLKNRYSQMETNRLSALNRGRACAALTIPALLPPAGHSASSPLPSPWQSIGARGVNHLSSKLSLALFPPNSPFFELQVDPFVLEKMLGNPELKADVEQGLGKVERAVMTDFESYALRSGIFEALKHLIVAGNVLIYVNPNGGVRIYRLDRYVVKRDPMGHVMEIIIKEDISPLELSDAGRAALANSGWTANAGQETEDSVELYTRVYRRPTHYLTYQEINGSLIEGSIAQYPLDKCPFIALRWTEIDNEDYGRGLCEEYFGDLRSLEGLTKAIVQGSAAAAKVLFLVRPNSTTKAKVLAESESGDIREGNAEDVTVLQMQKYADFKVAAETRAEIKQTLSLAFLLNTAIQRNGERVTAEEIRFMAEELESSLGGVYSALSQTLQRPIVTVRMAQMQLAGRLPALPDKVVKVSITTGIEAIGRGVDLNRLKSFVGDLANFAQAAPALDPYLNINNLIKRLGTGYSIDADGLVRTEDQTAAIQQQQQQQAMAHQLGPHMINQGGNLMKQAMQQQGGSNG